MAAVTGTGTSGSNPLDAAAAAVAATAGLNFNGLPSGAGLGSLLNPAQMLVAQNPGSYQYVSGRTPGMEFSNGNTVFDANGRPTSPTPGMNALQGVATGQTSGPQGPSLSDVLSAILGGAPQPSDYSSGIDYQGALGSIAAGNTAAQGQINNAYNSAQSNLTGLDAILNKGATQDAAQFAAQQAAGKSNFDQYAQQAQQLGGQGGQLGDRMNQLGALFAAQQANEGNLNGEVGAVGRFNAAQDQAGLGAAKQAALNSLAANVTAAQNKINTASVNDQGRAQAAYAKAAAAYQAKENSLKSQAYNGLQAAGGFGGRDWAAQQQTGWSQAAAAGDQNAQALSGAVSGLMDPQNYGGKAPTFEQAQSFLNQNAQHLGGQGSIMYGVVQNWLTNYYGRSKDTLGGNPTASDYANYLSTRYFPQGS